jgi:hypothetical protein
MTGGILGILLGTSFLIAAYLILEAVLQGAIDVNSF